MMTWKDYARWLVAIFVMTLLAKTCHAQASPFSISTFKAQTFTATGQTGAPIQLNSLTVPSTVGSSFSSGCVEVTGTGLTTVTFAVQGSALGTNYYPLPTTSVGTTSFSTTQTATAPSLYCFSLAGLAYVRFVTSGTFTATAVSIQMTASPNASISSSSGSGGGAQFPSSPAVVCSTSTTNSTPCTPTNLASVLLNATGCNQEGDFVYKPSTNSCVAAGGGSPPAGVATDVQTAGPGATTFSADTGVLQADSTNHVLFGFNQNFQTRARSGGTPLSSWNTPYNGTLQSLNYFNFLVNPNINGQQGGITSSFGANEAAPGQYWPGQESGGRGLVGNCNMFSLGINQCGPTGFASIWGAGDKAFYYHYLNYAGCGYGNGDDEQCEHHATAASDLEAVATGTITSLDSPNYGLRTTVNAGGPQPGAGRPLILLKNADGSSTSVTSGCKVTADGVINAQPYGPGELTVTGCALPVSTTWGQATGPINTTRTYQTQPVSTSVPVTVLGGAQSFTMAGSGNTYVCVGDGTRFQVAQMTAVSGSGSSQTLSLNLTELFVAPLYNPYVFQGGLCETVGREDAGLRVVGSNTMDLTFNILGALDGTHLIYDIPIHGTSRLLSTLDPDVVPLSYTGVTLARDASGTVTGTGYTDGGVTIPVGGSITVSGGGDFNGTFTTIPPTCGVLQCVSWAQSGSVETVGSATIASNINVQGLSVYPASEIISVVNPGAVSTWQTGDSKPGGYLQTRPNDVTWPISGTVEVGFGSPGFTYEQDSLTSSATLSTGNVFTCNGGLACTAPFVHQTYINGLDASVFRFGGGRYTPPDVMQLYGYYQNVYSLFRNKFGNGGMPPQSNWVTAPCYDMAARADGQWNYLNANFGDSSVGYFTVDCYNKAVYLGTSTGQGLSQVINHAYLGADEFSIMLGGQAYSSDGRIELGRNRLGTAAPGGPFTTGLNFWNYFGFSKTIPANGIHLCQGLFGTSNTNLEVGSFISANFAICNATGQMDVGAIFASSAMESNGLNVGLHQSASTPTFAINTAGSGNFGYFYELTASFGESESIAGVSVLPLTSSVSTTDPNLFTTSNFPTLACPALDSGYPTGTVWKVYSVASFLYPGTTTPTGVRAGTAYLGTCNPSTTFSDNNTTPAVASAVPDKTSGMPVYAGDWKGNYNSVVGFRPDNLPSTSHSGTWPLDVAISRHSANYMRVGNGTQDDNSGTWEAAHFIGTDFNGTAAKAIALANTPTLCPSGQAPTGVDVNGNAVGCQAVGGGGGGGSILTAAASGGAAPGSTYDGSMAVTFDYHSFGADAVGAAAAAITAAEAYTDAAIVTAKTIAEFTNLTFTPTALNNSCQTVSIAGITVPQGKSGTVATSDGSSWFPFTLSVRVPTANAPVVDICDVGSGTPTFTSLNGTVQQ